MIEVSNLTKRYTAESAAVDNISFTIEKGHIYGLLGRNGAGKTTTLNLLTGALAATDGKITVCGHDLLTDPEAAKACIGYLPELPPLYPELTPAEVLSFVAEARGIPGKDRPLAVRKALNATDTFSVRHQLISSLSKGYRQRVGIAQAMVGDPPILILDEPTVGLDPGQVLDLRKLILSLGKDHTVILSSHILSEIAEVCDRILILSDGKLVADDSLEALLRKHPARGILDLSVAAPAEKAKQILQTVHGIGQATYTQEGRECRIRLICSDKQDIREAVFFAFAAAHKAILSMGYRQTTLEDIFLSITDAAAKSDENPQIPVKKKKKTPQMPVKSPSKKKISLLTDIEKGKTNPDGETDTDDEDDGDDYRPLFRS
ncbi:MAG: ABC transporter ATP-binding protein [Eubacteriales bacterium]